MVMIIKTYEIPRDRIASERRHPESPSLGNFSGFIAGVNMKKCSKCKKVKKLSEFSKRTTARDGLMFQCKLCSKEYAQKPEAKARSKVNKRNFCFKRNYGITLEQYRNMLTNQNNVCSICGKEETVVVRGTRHILSVDHCHGTNRIRGLLCGKCNRGLGAFDDNIDVMASAISYLKQCG